MLQVPPKASANSHGNFWLWISYSVPNLHQVFDRPVWAAHLCHKALRYNIAGNGGMRKPLLDGS